MREKRKNRTEIGEDRSGAGVMASIGSDGIYGRR
jgi:hypothetical protein